MLAFLTDHYVLITIVVFSAIFITYLIANRYATIIESSPANETDFVADMIYYLPTATVQIAATAKVVVLKDPNNIVQAAQLLEISLENTISIIPDTTALVAVKYDPNIFMNDEVKLTAGTTGLLDTVLTSTDDQLSNIIKQVADAPSQILSMKTADVTVPVVPANMTSATLTYNKTFHIMPNESLKQPAPCPWIINTDGTAKATTNVNAGFQLTFDRPGNFTEKTPSLPVKFGGLLTRPLTTLTFKIKLNDDEASGSSVSDLQVIVPDIARLVKIPLKRSAFVKRINTPKFSSGLIMENYINIPSQFEGFINIPINIIKTLISIPAALFNFTIHHKYDNQLTDLANQKKLLDAKNALKKQPDIKKGPNKGA